MLYPPRRPPRTAAYRDSVSVRPAEQAVPYLTMEVDATALGELKIHPAVTSIQKDIAVPPTLEQSVPLINADDATVIMKAA